MIPITAVVCTKGRYHTTLPLVLMGIINQVMKPAKLFIFDDNDKDKREDLSKDPIYSHLYSMLTFANIPWEIKWPPESVGQVANHMTSLDMAQTDWIWRLDDDTVPEPNCLQILASNIASGVGAIGGLIIPGNNIQGLPVIASNKIEDIFLGLNEQWYLHPPTPLTVDTAKLSQNELSYLYTSGAIVPFKSKEVDHLYSSFIYRRKEARYETSLSHIGHREETLMTYELKRKGFKILLDPTARTWHFNYPTGGIRSDDVRNMIVNDEHVFMTKLKDWKVKLNEYSFIVLEHGLGDHFAFKKNLKKYREHNLNKKHVFFVAHPTVFEDEPDITLASIADAKNMFGSLDKFSPYRLMIAKNWKASLVKAYTDLYGYEEYLEEQTFSKPINSKNIIISPYSFVPWHAKSYPYWAELVQKLKGAGYKIIQIGRKGEEPINGCEHVWDKTFKALETMLLDCRCWIAVDNFLGHFINTLDVIVPGITIWGESDPKIYGYNYNLNILKDPKYLRSDQFGWWVNREKTPWEYRPRNNEMYESANIVFEKIMKHISLYRHII